MSVNLYSLGAAQEVTGSKHVLDVDGRLVMIDCGAFQGKRKEADEKNRKFDIAVDKLHSIILTHGHYDHCGLLPVAVQKGFSGNIYATPATRDLANLVMMDSARIQARDAEYLRKQSLKKGEKFTWNPLFDEQDCVRAANQIVTLSYNRKMFIDSDMELEFFDAGHILGSSFAYLTIKDQKVHEGKLLTESDISESGDSGAGKSFFARFFEKINSAPIADRRKEKKDFEGEDKRESQPEQDEIRILFSGDLGRKNKAIIRDPSTNVPAPDYIVLESTYGDRRHEDSAMAMKELAKIVRRAMDKKGKIIIPSFSIERTQELVYYLHLLVDQKKIPPLPIYVDSPMSVNATGIFQVHPECYDDKVKEAFLKHHKNPFGFGQLSFITSVDESKALNKKEGPMIIISADGMCEAGRILHHLANNISDSRNTILIVGFMAENTLGRRIRDGEKEVKIMGDWYQVEASVEAIGAFSAHADYYETTEWLKAIDTSRLKRIFLVHGEKEGQNFFKDYLEKNGYEGKVDIVKYGDVFCL